MNIDEIKTPQDILFFMDKNIRYGWLDINGCEHIAHGYFDSNFVMVWDVV